MQMGWQTVKTLIRSGLSWVQTVCSDLSIPISRNFKVIGVANGKLSKYLDKFCLFSVNKHNTFFSINLAMGVGKGICWENREVLLIYRGIAILSLSAT